MLPVRAINVVHKLHLENKNKELPKKKSHACSEEEVLRELSQGRSWSEEILKIGWPR
jgi:hypothetical protein